MRRQTKHPLTLAIQRRVLQERRHGQDQCEFRLHGLHVVCFRNQNVTLCRERFIRAWRLYAYTPNGRRLRSYPEIDRYFFARLPDLNDTVASLSSHANPEAPTTPTATQQVAGAVNPKAPTSRNATPDVPEALAAPAQGNHIDLRDVVNAEIGRSSVRSLHDDAGNNVHSSADEASTEGNVPLPTNGKRQARRPVRYEPGIHDQRFWNQKRQRLAGQFGISGSAGTNASSAPPSLDGAADVTTHHTSRRVSRVTEDQRAFQEHILDVTVIGLLERACDSSDDPTSSSALTPTLNASSSLTPLDDSGVHDTMSGELCQEGKQQEGQWKQIVHGLDSFGHDTSKGIGALHSPFSPLDECGMHETEKGELRDDVAQEESQYARGMNTCSEQDTRKTIEADRHEQSNKQSIGGPQRVPRAHQSDDHNEPLITQPPLDSSADIAASAQNAGAAHTALLQPMLACMAENGTQLHAASGEKSCCAVSMEQPAASDIRSKACADGILSTSETEKAGSCDLLQEHKSLHQRSEEVKTALIGKLEALRAAKIAAVNLEVDRQLRKHVEPCQDASHTIEATIADQRIGDGQENVELEQAILESFIVKASKFRAELEEVDERMRTLTVYEEEHKSLAALRDESAEKLKTFLAISYGACVLTLSAISTNAQKQSSDFEKAGQELADNLATVQASMEEAKKEHAYRCAQLRAIDGELCEVQKQEAEAYAATSIAIQIANKIYAQLA